MFRLEPGPGLSDSEQLRLTEGSGIKAFGRRAALPEAPEAR